MVVFCIIIGRQENKESFNEVIDAKDSFVLPGFIDIHTHGGNGIDVNHASKEGILRLSEFFAIKGVISSTHVFNAMGSIHQHRPDAIAITDSIRTAGLEDGNYKLGVQNNSKAYY